jgi:hypothetical protein
MTTMPTGMAGVSRTAKLDSFLATYVPLPTDLPFDRLKLRRRLRLGFDAGILPFCGQATMARRLVSVVHYLSPVALFNASHASTNARCAWRKRSRLAW